MWCVVEAPPPPQLAGGGAAAGHRTESSSGMLGTRISRSTAAQALKGPVSGARSGSSVATIASMPSSTK